MSSKLKPVLTSSTETNWHTVDNYKDFPKEDGHYLVCVENRDNQRRYTTVCGFYGGEIRFYEHNDWQMWASEEIIGWSPIPEPNVSYRSERGDSKYTEDEIERAKNIVYSLSDAYFESGIFCRVDWEFDKMINRYGLDSAINSLRYIVESEEENDEGDKVLDSHLVEGVLHILLNCKFDSTMKHQYYDIWNMIYKKLPDIKNGLSSSVIDPLIACVETWEAWELIPSIEDLEIEASWLSKYRDKVIKEIRGQ